MIGWALPRSEYRDLLAKAGDHIRHDTSSSPQQNFQSVDPSGRPFISKLVEDCRIQLTIQLIEMGSIKIFPLNGSVI